MRVMDLKVKNALAEGGGLLDELWKQLDGLEATSEGGRQGALVRFHAVLDHVDGLLVLIARGNVAPVLALIRPTLECLVRGMWLFHCATPSQVAAFYDGQVPRINSMIAAIEKSISYPGSALSQLAARSLTLLHGLTHAGSEIDQFMFDGSALAPNIPSEHLVEITQWCSGMALMAAVQMAAVAGDGAVADYMLTHAARFTDQTAVLP